MRVLHVVKTSDGAAWAAHQAEVLVRSGIEVHVALPRAEGRTVQAWQRSGAHIHIADLSLPVRRPGQFPSVARTIRRLMAEVQPDLIHSHFVTTTLALRLALGKNHRIPRAFQVPGPLHLEYWHTRQPDLLTAGEADYWIGSSRCIVEHYRRAGVPNERLFLSYYGAYIRPKRNSGALRKRLGVAADATIVGNINFIYPPKRLLGERVGLKGHELVIEALAEVIANRDRVYGVLIGGTLPGYRKSYEQVLRDRAARLGHGRIMMPGYFGPSEVAESWAEFDCAVHVPLSENCGGVVEPLAAGVPVIAAKVGGLPEVIMDDLTGKLVEERSPQDLAGSILQVISNIDYWRRKASLGRRLVEHMFDVQRTAGEVSSIYSAIVHGGPKPEWFDSEEFVTDAVGLATV